MEKKGTSDLLNTVLGVIVAIIVLLILGYLVYLIYTQLRDNEFKSAQKNLDFVISKIDGVSTGQQVIFSLQSPCKKEVKNCGWYLVGWGKDEKNKPERCYFDSCICMCNGDMSNLAANCQDTTTGICRKVNFDIVNVSVFTTATYVMPETDGVNVNKYCKGIPLKNPLSDFVLKENKNYLSIFRSISNEEGANGQFFDGKKCNEI